MVLYAGRSILAAPWPGGTIDHYYWEHCFWVNRSDFTSDGQMGLAVINDMKLLYTDQVRIWSTRWYVPGTTTVYFQQIYGVPQIGSQDPQDNYSLLIAARWRMRGEDGSYTYHLHRQPVGEDYLESGAWSSTGYTQQQTRMNTFIAQGIYRTKTGSLIDSGEVSILPTMWQLRHGTKRRNSRFWLP